MSSQSDSFDLDSKYLGALPIAHHFLARLQIEALLDSCLPSPDPRSKVPAALVLMALLRSLIVCRIPLYSMAEWVVSMLPAVLGLTADQTGAVNDDRIGRALDELFQSDRQALLTRFVLGMVREFEIRLDELHNDSTTLTFQGDYEKADGRTMDGKPTHRITFGHNKDDRPDLKQLLWILTVSSDGAVPVHFKVDDGNVGDPTTHIETWNVLRQLVGGPGFLYVADCKLCTGDNMRTIDEQHGSFITILPGNRKENDWFREWLAAHDAAWQDITWIKRPGQAEPDRIQALESPIPEVNGFRLIWFRSTHKCRYDAEKRQDGLIRAGKALEKLEEKLQKPRCRLKTTKTIKKEANRILEETATGRWIEYTIERTLETTGVKEESKQPGKLSRITRTRRWRFRLTWQTRNQVVHAEARSDGVVPLVTNCKRLSSLHVYVSYHCNQPLIEKRHDLLKNTLQVTPAYLHSVSRLEALLFLEYLAVTVHALVERELRKKMEDNHVNEIPVYPEARECKAPTAERVFNIFEHVQVHNLLANGRRIRTFQPQLTQLQRQLLELLGVSPLSYTDCRE